MTETSNPGPATSPTPAGRGLRALGAGHTRYRYDSPSADMLDVFDNQHPGSAWVVALDCTEFTALCPVTGQPDFGRIHIHYVPGSLCVESKSLKLYLGAYRNQGTFHEDCVNRIADDLSSRLQPLYLRVYGDFVARGGIAIRPLAVRTSAHLSPAQRETAEDLIAQHDRLRR